MVTVDPSFLSRQIRIGMCLLTTAHNEAFGLCEATIGYTWRTQHYFLAPKITELQPQRESGETNQQRNSDDRHLIRS